MRYLMVDRITSWRRGEAIAGLKLVAMSEDVLEHHFPRNPVMPGVLLLESLVQLAGWLEAASSDFTSWFLLDRVERVAFHAFVVPGDVLALEVTAVAGATGGRRAFACRGLVEGKRVVVAEIAGSLVPLAELEDPERQRRRFSHLLRHGG